MREKKKHDEYEVSLDEEEKVLESIQDSLKGLVIYFFLYADLTLNFNHR